MNKTDLSQPPWSMGSLEEHFDAKIRALEKHVENSDKNLSTHIEHQFGQIQTALDSAEKLETARFEALRTETQLIFEASQKAIEKAEAATDKRFSSVNEFRQSLDDAQKREKESRADFVRREVFEQWKSEIERWHLESKGAKEGWKASGGLIVGGASVLAVLIMIATVIVSVSIFVARASVPPMAPTSTPVSVTNPASKPVPVTTP